MKDKLGYILPFALVGILVLGLLAFVFTNMDKNYKKEYDEAKEEVNNTYEYDTDYEKDYSGYDSYDYNIEEDVESDDEYIEDTTEDYSYEESNTSHLEDAKDAIEPIISQSFTTRYNLIIDKKSNSVVLIGHLSVNDIANATLPEWNGLVDTMKYASKNSKEYLDTMGYSDVHFVVVTGDIDADRFYLTAIDGVVTYDAINGIGSSSEY